MSRPVEPQAATLEPVAVDPSERERWSEARPFAFRVAYFLARYSPRGQGWFPRHIGARFCRDMRLLLRTEHDALIAVDPRSLDYYGMMLKLGGIVDAHVRDACLRMLRPGDVFYDIGANAGLISIEVAKAMRGEVRVVAFEPQPRLAHVTALSGMLNGFRDWRVYAIMLGREAGNADLFIPAATIHASAISRQRGAPSITCPVRPLDALVKGGVIPPPQVIKIDVEGGERDVFAGAAETIRSHQPSIVFEADANQERFGYGRRELLEQLGGLAPYRFHFLRGKDLVPAEGRIDDPTFTDMIAIPAQRETR